MERPLIKRAARDLRPLFDPQSIAVLGATDTPGKWGFWLAQNALRSKDRRRVFLVNRSGREIFGERSYPSLRELPGPAELVLISVDAAAFEDAVTDSLAAGARALVAITAGLGELGGKHLALERRVAERVRQAGAILVGPNCLGIADTANGVNLAFGDFAPGPVALISQSGNLALELALIAKERGIGFSRFISVGNQADLDITELIDDLATHEATRVIAVYAEAFGDGREFARAALHAHEAGKPVVLLTVGSSGAAARAARSHTGALVSASVAVDAACRAAGILRVTTPREMLELAQGLLAPHQPRGRRVGIAGDGGGHVALAADLATGCGLELPVLSPALSKRIAAFLPSNAATANPVDLAGGGEEDFYNYARAVQELSGSGEVDSVMLTGYFGGYSTEEEVLARREAEVAASLAQTAARGPATLMVQTMYPASPTLDALRRAGVPIFGDTRSAALVLSRLAKRSQPWGMPDHPAPAAGHLEGAGYFASRRFLESAGISFVDAREVTGAAAAAEAAQAIGYPVVLKALGAQHKSNAGGVRVGIKDGSELSAALAGMQARLGVATYSVEHMAAFARSAELLVGVKWDHSFGPVLLIGLGGLLAEVLSDVAVALAPVSEVQAEALIRSLRVAPMLLEGGRGGSRLDVAGAAHVAALLSRVAAANAQLAEIEINPLLVGPESCVALDARMALN